MKRTTTGTVTGLRTTRKLRLKGATVAKGTLLTAVQVAGVRLDHLISKGLITVVDGILPLRSGRHGRDFHMVAGDHRSHRAIAVAPTVASVSNGATGAAAGGHARTITGTGFTGATAVTFGGTAATSRVVVNSTTITCVTPAHAAGSVTVAVTTPYGTGSKPNGYVYT